MAEIEDHLAENYEGIVADESRSDTFKSIAEEAEANGSPDLAAWARRRAAETGKDVTPRAATTAPTETRTTPPAPAKAPAKAPRRAPAKKPSKRAPAKAAPAGDAKAEPGAEGFDDNDPNAPDEK